MAVALNVAASGLEGASLWTSIVALGWPTVDGLKLTSKSQVVPAASGLEVQSGTFRSVNAPASGPEMEIEAIETGALPELVSSKVWATGAAPTVTEPKSCVEGLSSSPG